MTTTKLPRDLLYLRAADGRRVQVQVRKIKTLTPSDTGPVHAHVDLYKGGRAYVVLADPAELAT